MLILSNEDIATLVTVEGCIPILEKAYKEHAAGKAVNRPRTDVYLPSTTARGVYVFKSMEGGLVDSKVVALRLNSDVIRWEDRGGRTVKDKMPVAAGDKWVGLILLFSAETGEPLAIFPDGVIQSMRVAASSALAAREMARRNASVLGIFGSGWQAAAHVPAMCAVRAIKKIKIYSPTKVNREKFAKEMEERVGIEVHPVEKPEEAVHEADILVAATNAITRVIHPDWLTPGIHFTCVKPSELGDEAIRKADRIIIHTRRIAPENYIAGYGNARIEAHDPLGYLFGEKRGGDEIPAPFWANSPEIQDLLAGHEKTRQSEKEITCFVNNIGLGIQFAAVGATVFEKAKARGLGREIPTEWFLQSVHP